MKMEVIKENIYGDNMDQIIDKEVLEYMEIYKTKEATEEKIKLGLKIKDEITKLTGLEIERVYLMDEYAWGKSDDTPSFCFLSDVRIRDVESVFNDVKKYSWKENKNILVWSMCQFEKRKNNPTELDYYIENYGVKIYDTGKLVDINERVKVTEYASKMDNFRFIYEYEEDNPKALLKDLLEIYALKIDYPMNMEQNLGNTIKYIKHISKDEYVLKAIEEFDEEEADKLKICRNLEKYIKKLKQTRPKMELDNIPTMKVYERLLDIKNKVGKVSVSNLTKDNLYAMEVIQDHILNDISELFDIDEKELSKMRKKFEYRVLDSIWYEHIGELIAKCVDENMDKAYSTLKEVGVFNFEKHTYDILKYMSDGEKYLLKEFWKLTNGEREGIELSHAKTAKDVYFRAYLCAELLKQNAFIEETDFLTYKITKKGKDLLEKLKHIDIEELNLLEIAKITGESNFYALSIIILNNGEIMYCGNSDELDKYCEHTEEWEEIVLDEGEQHIELYGKEDKDIVEVSFEDVAIKRKVSNVEKGKTRRTKADYNKINMSKEKVGKDSEKLVFDLEKERLINENRKDLAEGVLWESEENGDGAGYDIKSFEKKDEEYIEIYIEVKGTNKGINEPFDISKNEIEASNKYKEQYYIYRVANIYSNKPKFYKINGRIEDNFNLEATSFKARKK